MLLISLLGVATCISNISPVESLCDDTVKQKFGYLPTGSGAKLFYWFFESRKDPAASPTLIYFQGGPGGSSMYSLTSGNGGPCILNRQGDDTSLNVHSYNTFANIMYIDQPAPTGFSTGKAVNDSVEAAKSTFLALSIFLKQYPIYNTQVFFIGQSYAGHFIPPLARFTHAQSSFINLKGVILGNSMVNPKVQYQSMPEMAYNSGTTRRVITEEEYQNMRKALPGVLSDMQHCLSTKEKTVCQDASNKYSENFREPIKRKRISLFDLSKDCTEPAPGCEYLKNYRTYFNSKKVQGYLQVNKKWRLYDPQVLDAFTVDLFIDYSADLAAILNQGLRVMIYAGDQDYTCNWIGNRDMSLGIQWAGRHGFSKADDRPYFLPNGKQFGEIRRFTTTTGGQLSFARIFKAGHSAAKDSPEGVLKLVSDFVMGQSLTSFVV